MKRILAILMTICLLAGALSITAFAADEPATGVVLTVSGIKKDGTTVKIKDYTVFEDGWNEAMELAGDEDKMEENNYNRIVVDLYADWNANSEGEFGSGDGFDNDTIYIPEDAKITLNLNGYTINRGLTEDIDDGEVMFINDDADVIINKGTITGGYSNSEGGGLYIEGGANVTLNDVNIVGNAVKGDDGAGIYIYGGATLVMNGGSISNNFMDSKYTPFFVVIDPYGVICAKDSTVVLNNVTFDGNYTYTYSARGLVLYADGSTVKMDKCTVSNNATKESVTEDIIYANDSSLMITDTDFINNNTPKGASDLNPQLFYIEDSHLSLTGGKITKNGGEELFYFKDSESDITGVTITENQAGVMYVSNDHELVNVVECILGNNTPKGNNAAVEILKEGNLTMIDCVLGDTTFSNTAYVKIMTSEVSREDGVIGINLLDEDGTSASVRYYKDFASGWNYAMESAKTNTYDRVIVDLYADWNTKEVPTASGYVVSIPQNAKVTINMNGHKINRDYAGTTSFNGEVMYIDENADVIINDGTITGGQSRSGAGGIHIKDNAIVVLNNVNVIKNKTIGSNGAGIAVCEGAVLVMNGGSLSDNKMNIKLVGLGESLSLPVCPYGTLYVDSATATLNNVVINNNYTNDSDSEGMAIYADESTVTLNNCVVSNNAVVGVVEEKVTEYAKSIIGAENSTLVINNTDFTGNSAVSDTDDSYYSLLFSLEASSLTMEGGKITGNSSDKIFHFEDSGANIKGVTITDNASLVLDVENDFAKVTMTECTLGNNTSAEFGVDVMVDTEDTLVMIDCEIDDTTFEDKSKVMFSNKAVGSIFGEGSLTMIISILALIASGTAIFLVVYYSKKKAAPAAANGATDTETDDEE